jgi:hypothetical protein
MSYIRKVVRKNRDGTVKTYYAEVEGVRIGNKVVQRYIRSLGTNPNKPSTIDLDHMHFGYIATRLMQGDLTPEELFRVIERMGNVVPFEDLEAIGIRYNFKKNVLTLSLYPVRKSKMQGDVPNAAGNSASKKRESEK